MRVELTTLNSVHQDDDEDVDDAAADKLLATSPTASVDNSSSGEEPEEPSDAYKYQRPITWTTPSVMTLHGDDVT